MQNTQFQFFVLPKQIISLQILKGMPEMIDCGQVKQDISTEGVINALKYRFQLKYLGKSCQKLLVLCIPAHEHKIQPNTSQIYHQFLPIIKTFKETNLKGYKSGRRSAILMHKNKLFRYKGCGNDIEGFIYENNNLRGSHFYHTAKRQMFMTNLINNYLQEEIKQTSANIPLAFYQYTSQIEQLQLKNELKLLSKYCCVFETKGDRRLGTHLISPLEIIFLNILQLNSTKLNDFFNEKKRQDGTGLTQLLIDFQFSLEQNENFIEKYMKSQQFGNYVSIDDYQSFNKERLRQKIDVESIINKLARNFSKQYQFDEHFSQEIDWIYIINIILKKIGWQMGEIKRIFCQKNINWGFFNDHGYWHCNAHLNNFIVKPPQANSRLTLPLDFDLAFTKEEYINIDLDSKKYGQKDDQNFEQLLLSEYNSMEMSISGLEIMNFKYGIQGQTQQAPSNQMKMGRIIFRDTLIRTFRASMKENNSIHATWNNQWNKNIIPINKLIHLCLKMSSNFQT